MEHLKEVAGEAIVEVMCAPRGAIFDGDMEQTSLLSTDLSAFLDGSLEDALAAREDDSKSPDLALYLAQSPLCYFSTYTRKMVDGPLHALLADIDLPPQMRETPLWQVNLWANRGFTTSSLHYDPHHNLLCVVTGRKTVRMLPPSYLAALDIRPPHHESSNHARDDLWGPKFIDEVGGEVMGGEVQLRPGDAVFIPEGWLHQVRSHEETGWGDVRIPGTAINIWWSAPLSVEIGKPKQTYVLRRIAQNLAEKTRRREVQNIITESQVDALRARGDELAAAGSVPSAEGIFLESGSGTWVLPKQLSPAEAAALENLESWLFKRKGKRARGAAARGRHNSPMTDVLAATLALGRDSLMRVMLTAREKHPDSMAKFLLALDDYGAWELLTTGMELEDVPDEVLRGMEQFYEQLYSCVGAEKQRLTEKILKEKAMFAKACMFGAIGEALQWYPDQQFY